MKALVTSLWSAVSRTAELGHGREQQKVLGQRCDGWQVAFSYFRAQIETFILQTPNTMYVLAIGIVGRGSCWELVGWLGKGGPLGGLLP